MDTRFICCEACDGDGRRSSGYRCLVCDGRGEVEIETSPITMEDLDAEA